MTTGEKKWWREWNPYVVAGTSWVVVSFAVAWGVMVWRSRKVKPTDEEA